MSLSWLTNEAATFGDRIPYYVQCRKMAAQSEQAVRGTYPRNLASRLLHLLAVPLREGDVGRGGTLGRRHSVLVHLGLLVLELATGADDASAGAHVTHVAHVVVVLVLVVQRSLLVRRRSIPMLVLNVLVVVMVVVVERGRRTSTAAATAPR